MKALIRFRRITETSNYCSVIQKKNINNYTDLFGLKAPKHLAGFPNIDKLWEKYIFIKLNENASKRELLDQFINESQINKPNLLLNIADRTLLMRTNIRILIEHDFVSSVTCVINGLLAELEQFPFDRSELLDKKQNEPHFTIKDIRNEVEKQYLAWRFKVHLQDISAILMRYRLCLYEYRSIRNLKKNIELIQKFQRVPKLSVAEKIYHLNQKPFHLRSVQLFEGTIAGLQWQLVPSLCPKLLKYSHQYIVFVVSMLKDMNFTEQQIQHGLPFLHIMFDQVIQRLGNMFSNPEIAKHRNEIKFLELLSFPINVINHMVNSKKASFTELTEIVGISSKDSKPSHKFLQPKFIFYHIHQFYEVNFSCLENIKKHPQLKLSSEKQVLDTLMFLQSKGFETKEVEESIAIVLYPRKGIEKALAKIDSEAETLKKYGFTNGCLQSETNFFKKGTREKQKVLQLCLYYLEKPHNFSGDGIWDGCEGTSD